MAKSADRNTQRDPLAVSAREAARLLGVGERTLWDLTKSRAIPHVRIGRRVLYPLAGLRGWLDRQTRQSL